MNQEAIDSLRAERDGWIAAVQDRDAIIKQYMEAAAALAAENKVLRDDNTHMTQAMMHAYGHLWHVNNEPMAPVPLYSPEKAAYEARKILRDMLTSEHRGIAINQVQALIDAALTKEATK